MTLHEHTPTIDEIRQAIWATTVCNCTPDIEVQYRRRGRVKVRATHEPTCALRHGGHQQIRLGGCP